MPARLNLKNFLAPGEKFVNQMNLLGFKTGRLSAVEKKSPNFWPRYLDKNVQRCRSELLKHRFCIGGRR